MIHELTIEIIFHEDNKTYFLGMLYGYGPRFGMVCGSTTTRFRAVSSSSPSFRLAPGSSANVSRNGGTSLLVSSVATSICRKKMQMILRCEHNHSDYLTNALNIVNKETKTSDFIIFVPLLANKK